MKIKAVEKICRSQHGMALIGTEPGEQWLGVGMALYPLYGFPQMDENSVFAWMDVPEKKRKDFSFRFEYELPKAIDFSDSCAGEQILTRMQYSINTSSGCLVPINVSEGVVYVEESYLKPFGEDAQLYERKSAGGNLYIAVKEGLLLKGVILPTMVTQSFADDLLDIARQTRLAKKYIVSEETED